MNGAAFTPQSGAARDYGCLRCLVTWRGAAECWLCGAHDFVVGAAVVRQRVNESA